MIIVYNRSYAHTYYLKNWISALVGTESSLIILSWY